MSRLTDLSLANRSLAALATVIVAIAGVISALTLRQELLPGYQLPIIAATTTVPGADADVVDSQVTRSVEAAAQSLDGVKTVQSTSSIGLSVVSVTLDYGTDVKAARTELQAAVADIQSMPAGATSRVVAGDFDDFPVMQVAVTPPASEAEAPGTESPGTESPDGVQLDPTSGEPVAPSGGDEAFVAAVRELAVPRLNRVDGVRDVQLGGTGSQQVTITLNESAAAAAGVSISTVSAALASNGIAVPAGSITEGASALNVQVGAPFSTVDEIASIPLLGAMPSPSTPPGAAAVRPGGVTPSGTPSTNGAPVRAAAVDAPVAPTACVAAAGEATCVATCTFAPDQERFCLFPRETTTTTATTTTTVGGVAQTRTVTAPAQTVTSTQRVTVPQYVTVQAPAPIDPDVPVPTLGSVATVTMGDAPVSGYTRTDGKPSLTLGVRATNTGNTVAISSDVREQLQDLSKLTGGTYTVVYDQAPYIEESIKGLSTEGLLGLGFAVLVVLLFLFSLRMTLVTAVSIPLSLLVALIGLKLSGHSLNILTLGALTIAVGRVVDDSIVVVENIKRHVDAGESKLVAIPVAVREVAGAITASTLTTAAVFVPIAVVGGQVGELFRPFAWTVVIALAASLLVSLTVIPVLAYWFISRRVRTAKAQAAKGAAGSKPAGGSKPAAAGAMPAASKPAAAATSQQPHTTAMPAVPPPVVPPHPSQAETEVIATPTPTPSRLPVGETSIIPSVTPPARPVPTPPAARPAAGQPAPAKAGAAKAGAAKVGAAKAGAGKTGPSAAKGFQRVRNVYLGVLKSAIKRPVITLLLAVIVLGLTAAGVTLVSTDLLGDAGQDTLVITQELPVGSSLAATDDAAQRVEAVLTDRQDVETFQATVGGDGASALVGGGVNTARYLVTLKDDADSEVVTSELRDNLASRPELGQFTVGAGEGSSSSAVEVQITGSDPEKLRLAADRVFAQVQALDGATEVTNNVAEAVPSLRVTVNRQAAADNGLSEAAIGKIVASALHGAPVGQVSVGANPYGAVVVAPTKPMSADELRNLAIGGTTLGALATVDEVQAATTIERVDGERVATVSAVPANADLGGFSSKVTQAVVDAKMPTGTSATIGGASAEQRSAFAQLGWALLAAIALVYLVMVAAFRSLIQPLLLLVSVPFAATGAIALLLVTRTPLGVAAIIGLLMLVGIVVTNAIVLIDLVNRYRTQGKGVRDAILAGGEARLRPILMTALATVMALVPMALSLTGGGAFVSQPLAIVVIGGLLSSTLLTLVIVPVLYWLVEGRQERAQARKARKAKAAAAKAGKGNSGKASGAGGAPAKVAMGKVSAGAARPSPTRSGPAQPGSVRSGPAQPGPSQPGPALPGSPGPSTPSGG